MIETERLGIQESILYIGEGELAENGYGFARYPINGEGEGYSQFINGKRAIFLRAIENGHPLGEFLVWDPQKIVVDHFEYRSLEEKTSALNRYKNSGWEEIDTKKPTLLVVFRNREEYMKQLTQALEDETDLNSVIDNK